MVNVTRPAGGISINAGIREYLLDGNGEPMAFESEEKAIEYLMGFGLGVDEGLDGIEFPVVGEAG